MKLSKVAKTINYDNHVILVGRNANMNDILTTEICKDNDIWLHVKGFPGSHVVIVRENESDDIPKSVIHQAAQLAGINSKGKGKLEVVYTLGENVSKPDDYPPGKVLVNYKKSNFIKITV